MCMHTYVHNTHMLTHSHAQNQISAVILAPHPPYVYIYMCLCMIVHAGYVMSLLLHPVHLYAPPLYSTAPLLLHHCLVLSCLVLS